MDVTENLDPMERLLVLQEVPLFAGLATPDLERIAAVVSERRYEPGEVVFAEGDLGDEMLIIVDGHVEVLRVTDDAHRTLGILGPGSPVGEMALLRRQPRSANVVAGADGMSALAIDATTLAAILQERPAIAFALLGTLADTLTRTSLLDP